MLFSMHSTAQFVCVQVPWTEAGGEVIGLTKLKTVLLHLQWNEDLADLCPIRPIVIEIVLYT